MYQYAEQEVENFFFIQSEILIAVSFMNMISLISFVLQYKEGSPGVNLVVVVERGGGQGTSPPPPPSPPLVEKVVDIQGITGDWSRPL